MPQTCPGVRVGLQLREDETRAPVITDQALMDAGKCAEARRVASEAGERAMAIRVRQTCRRRP